MAVPRWGKRVGIAALVPVVLIGAGASYLGIESWRGPRKWREVQESLRAKGEPLTLAEVFPPVLAEQNVAAAPIFAEVFDKELSETRLGRLKEPFSKGKSPSLGGASSGSLVDLAAWQQYLTGHAAPVDVLGALGKYDPILAELREALNRPAVRWPLNWASPLTDKRPYHYAVLPAFHFLALHSIAEAGAGHADRALDDVELSFRLADAVGKGECLIDYLVEVSGQAQALCSVAYGLRNRIWNAEQLQRLGEILSRQYPLGQFQGTMRGERVLFLSALRPAGVALRHRLPGMEDLDRADYAWTIQNRIIDAIDADRGVSSMEGLRRQSPDLEKQRVTPWSVYAHLYSNLLAPALSGAARKANEFQARIAEARTACALELYRANNGHLPDSTALLVPDCLSTLPPDPVTGRPLIYRREGGDDYLLYSIGWNDRDDGGLADGETKGKEGDWTWASRPDLYKFVPDKGP